MLYLGEEDGDDKSYSAEEPYILPDQIDKSHIS